jgi:hypothetical protein
VPDRVDEQVGHHSRQLAGVGGDEEAVVHVPAEAYAAGARDRVGTRQRLAHHVAQRDRLEVQGRTPAWIRESSKRSSTMRTIRSTSRGSGGGSERGRRPARPRAPRSSRASLRGASAGRGTPRRPAHAATPRAAARARATPAAGGRSCASSSLSSWSSAGPRGAASNRPLSPNRRASSRMVARPARERRADRRTRRHRDHAGHRDDPEHDRGRGRRGTSPRPCRPRRRPPPAPRSGPTTPTCQRTTGPHHVRERPAEQPGRAGPGAPMPMIAHWSVGHCGSHR